MSWFEGVGKDQAQEFETFVTVLRRDETPLEAIFDPDFRSPEQYERSTRKLKRAIEESIGFPPPAPTGTELSDFRRSGEDSDALYFRAKIPIFSGLWVVGTFVVPKFRTARAPLVVGIGGTNTTAEQISQLVQESIQRGYAVWIPYLLHDTDASPETRKRIDAQAREVGTSLLALEVSKVVHGLGVVLRRTEIDRNRIAVIGWDEGGLYALYAAAFDPHVAATVCASSFGARDGSPSEEPNNWPETLPPRRVCTFADSELAYLICPRALQIQAATGSTELPLEQVKKATAKLTQNYKKLKAAAKFQVVEIEGESGLDLETAWALIQKSL
jgi:dienelactone hydrolase